MSEIKRNKKFHEIENYEVINQKDFIWDSIKEGKEIEVLRIFHEGKFNSPLGGDYLDYSLDLYNYFKSGGESEAYSKYMSVAKTLEKMANDRILEDYKKSKTNFWEDDEENFDED